jgi:hypothetical protein
MLIRYGCELSVVVNQPTPSFCLVDIHHARRPDIIEESPLTSGRTSRSLTSAILLAIVCGASLRPQVKSGCVCPVSSPTAECPNSAT